MNQRPREGMIDSITARITSPEMNFVSEWRRTYLPLLELLPTLDDAQLAALDNVTRLYFCTTKSRMVSLSFLLHPTESEITWSAVFAISAYTEWLIANEDKYDKFIHTLLELRDGYGVTSDEHGKVASLLAHIKVREDYQTKSDGSLMYFKDKDVILLVEENHDRLDALMSYAGERRYRGLSDLEFREYAAQHQSLQQGWL